MKKGKILTGKDKNVQVPLHAEDGIKSLEV